MTVPADEILFSVIIPTYRDWSRLSKCLRALQAQTFPKSAFEVLVVNNDPNDDPPNGFEADDNVILLKNNKPGSYAARNFAARIAKGKFLAFTDSDCVPRPEWLENGYSVLQTETEILGGNIVIFKDADSDSTLVYEFEKAFSFNQRRNIVEGNFSVTANLMTTKAAFDVIGGFEEDTYSGGDAEWSGRARRCGYTIEYAENVEILHPSRRSISSLVAKKKRTSGGFFLLSFQSKSVLEKIRIALFLLRPPIKVLRMNFPSFSMKLRIFGLKWYLEWIGVAELTKLQLSLTNQKRS